MGGLPKIKLEQNFSNAAEIISNDKKHLDNNPKTVSKDDIIMLLKKIVLNDWYDKSESFIISLKKTKICF